MALIEDYRSSDTSPDEAGRELRAGDEFTPTDEHVGRRVLLQRNSCFHKGSLAVVNAEVIIVEPFNDSISGLPLGDTHEVSRDEITGSAFGTRFFAQ